MAVPRTKGILRKFEGLPDGIKGYLEHFPSLAEDYPWDVSLAYLFARIELAQNMTIYAALVKKHRLNSELARKAVDTHHMTRDGFRNLYFTVTDRKVKQTSIDLIKSAEKIRDKILHGKRVSDEEKRAAICSALGYCNELDEQVYKDAGFRPFGKLQGFAGRAKKLDKSTSRWVLSGMGVW